MKRLKPETIEIPPQKMAVVTTKGDPAEVLATVFPALYGSVFTLKFDLKKRGLETFKVHPPRARYPDAHLVPKDQWIVHWGLPVPSNTEALRQKQPDTEVKLETWDYGEVAQILHIGPYSEEGPTIALLHSFIEQSGFEIAGMHEEEYLTKPDSKVVKTIIRYQVRRRA